MRLSLTTSFQRLRVVLVELGRSRGTTCAWELNNINQSINQLKSIINQENTEQHSKRTVLGAPRVGVLWGTGRHVNANRKTICKKERQHAAYRYASRARTRHASIALRTHSTSQRAIAVSPIGAPPLRKKKEKKKAHRNKAATPLAHTHKESNSAGR